MQKKSIHSGHRNRIKERYLASGFQNFSLHEVLEMLLFYGIPRKDTNELAHRLINHFGSISAVFEASVDELKEFGVPENAAVLLRLIPEMGQAYLNDKSFSSRKRHNITKQKQMIRTAFLENNTESTLLILYNSKGIALFFGIVLEGPLSSSDNFTQKIIRIAVKYNAVSAVLAHNNLSGIAYPSENCIHDILRIKSEFAKVGVKLNDYYVVSDNVLFSMAHSIEFREIFFL